MPLKIHPPRKGSQAPRIRGTYRGIEIYRTVEAPRGATPREIRAAAKAKLKEIEDQIERGELGGKAGRLTWTDAAIAYVAAGGDGTFIGKLDAYFGDKPLEEIDQATVNEAALALYPDGAPATRNRQVYTPISAVIRHAMPERGLRLKRPKMPKGRVVWLEPAEVGRLVKAATENPPLRAAIIFMVYTGCRLGEALSLDWDASSSCRVILAEDFAWVAETKNEEPRGVHLPPVVAAELRAIHQETGSVFGYDNRWQFYKDLDPALAAGGIALPKRLKAHIFRHTYATWRRRLGHTPFDLVDAGIWKDIRSAMRYQHVVQTDAARGADDMPVPSEFRAALVPDKKKETA